MLAQFLGGLLVVLGFVSLGQLMILHNWVGPGLSQRFGHRLALLLSLNHALSDGVCSSVLRGSPMKIQLLLLA